MNQKIRVLQIIPNFGYGGAEMLVKDLLLAQDTQKLEMAACSLYPFSGTNIEEELRENNITVFYLDKELGPDPRMVKRLYDTFIRFKPHVIHTHRYAIRYTLIPSILCQVPVKIHTIHNIARKEVDLAGRIIHFLSFKLFNYKPIAISKIIGDTAKDYYKIDNISHIHNCISTEKYLNNYKMRLKTRILLNIDDDSLVIIHVGRFFPQKNHRLLIESFSRVLSKINNVKLLMVGDGDLRPEIEGIVNRNGLNSHIKFLGVRKDIADLLSASDIFVLSSDWEGLPLTVIEAMAAGKPVVATAVGGVPELIKNNVNGFLVQPKDPDSLAQALIKMAGDREASREMGAMGRKMAREKFDIRIMAKAYENLYLDELNKNYPKKCLVY